MIGRIMRYTSGVTIQRHSVPFLKYTLDTYRYSRPFKAVPNLLITVSFSLAAG